MTAAPKHLEARGRKGEPEPKRNSSSLTTVGLYLKMCAEMEASPKTLRYLTGNGLCSRGEAEPRWIISL